MTEVHGASVTAFRHICPGCLLLTDEAVCCDRCWQRVPLDLRVAVNAAQEDEEWYADEAKAGLICEIVYWLQRNVELNGGQAAAAGP